MPDAGCSRGSASAFAVGGVGRLVGPGASLGPGVSLGLGPRLTFEWTSELVGRRFPPGGREGRWRFAFLDLLTEVGLERDERLVRSDDQTAGGDGGGGVKGLAQVNLTELLRFIA